MKKKNMNYMPNSLLPPRLIVNSKPFIRYSKISKRRKDHQAKVAPHLATKLSKPRTSCDVALAHFDDHYKKVFDSRSISRLLIAQYVAESNSPPYPLEEHVNPLRRWPSMRLGLMCQPKHCALVNNFSPVEEVKAFLKSEGCFSLKDAVRSQMEDSIFEVRDAIEIPESKERKVEKFDEFMDDIDPEILNDKSMASNEAEDRVIKKSDLVLSGINNTDALQNFIPADTLIGMEDIVEEQEYFKNYNKIDNGKLVINKVVDINVKFPKHLDAFVYPSSVVRRFKQPERTVLGTYNYFCMDAASLLPVIALGINPGDSVLDMCAGPGGKSLAMLQTLIPIQLTCNDISKARLRRVQNMLEMYMKGVGNHLEQVTYTQSDATDMLSSCRYNKILCDVPCYTDRHVIHEEEGNIFSVSRKTERIEIPILQQDVLESAIKSLSPGGSVVYSTCSLSPIQNDSVVHRALKSIWETTSINFYVNDLTPAFNPFKSVMNLVNEECSLRYGQLVLPHISNNFGPMYISKITRTN